MKKGKFIPRFSKGMRPLQGIVRPLIAPLLTKGGFAEGSLITDWIQIMGPDYGTMISPEKISFKGEKRTEGTLWIQVPSSMALMIQHQQLQILERINQYFGYRAIIKVIITQKRHVLQKEFFKATVDPVLNKTLYQILENCPSGVLQEALKGLADVLSYTKQSHD